MQKLSKRRITEGFVILAFALLVVWLVRNNQLVFGDFRHNLWAPTHLLLQGKSPYLIETLFPNKQAVWLPMAIGLFFPLGWLTANQAGMVWFLLSLAASVGIVLFASGSKRPSVLPFMLGVLFFVAYPRTIAHFLLGQYTILAVFLFIVAAWLVADGRLALAALALVVALAKPQLGLLVVPGLLLVSWRLHGSKMALRFLLYLGLTAVLLTIPLFAGNVRWLAGFVQAMSHNPTWLQPALFSLLPRAWGAVGLLLWVILFLLFFVFNLRIWQVLPPKTAVFWSLALTPLITPYVWSWDFVMLLPLFLWLLFRIKRPFAWAVALWGYAVWWGGALAVVLFTDGSDHRFWWASWFMFGLILAVYWIDAGQLPGKMVRGKT